MKLFRGIIKFFDKLFIIPLTKLILKITGNNKQSSKKFENVLSKPPVLLFISLILSIGIFVFVDQKILTFTDSNAEVFKDRKVEAIYNEEKYVVEGLPETVDITLIGSKADLYIAKQSKGQNVTVDLSGLKPGTHKVSIEYNKPMDGIEYSVNPSVATVVIYDKVSSSYHLDYDIINENKMDKRYVVDKVKLSKNEITIRGAQYKLDEVTSVKALIDASKIDTSVSNQTLDDVLLKAYDKDGNVVDVEFAPEKISADVEIASPSKDVSLNFVPKGNLPFGKAISAYSFADNKVTAYGKASVLKNLEAIDIEVNVDNISSDTTLDVAIPKPSGIRSLSITSTKLDLKITNIDSEPAKFNVSITGINVSSGLVAQPVDEDNSVIEVEVNGTKSVLESIKPEDITAYVDLKGKGEGTYELDISVKGKNPLAIYEAKKKKATIKVTKSK